MNINPSRQIEASTSFILLSKCSDELIDNFSKLPIDQMKSLVSQCAYIVKEYSTALVARKSFLVNTSGLSLYVHKLLNAIKLIITFNYCYGNFTIIEEYKKLYLSIPLALEMETDKEIFVSKTKEEIENIFEYGHNEITKDCRFVLFLELTSKIEDNIKFLEKDFNSFIVKIAASANTFRVTQ